MCRDYFEQYDIKTGLHRSATISAVDCSRLEPLAEICSGLFEKYRNNITNMYSSRLQRFYRSNYHWFYDLKSILIEAGINDDELKELDAALDGCVTYKAATPSFMGRFDIDVFSGFSMFLPSNGGDRLKEYYRTLDWNKATGLVK